MFKGLENNFKTEINNAKHELLKSFEQGCLKVLNENTNSISSLKLEFEKLKVEVDQKLIKAHQEYNEKLFTILSSFLRWNKEISLVSYLGGKEPDLKVLKRELMRPMMEEGWEKTNAEAADKINRAIASKGEKVRQAHNRYKEEKLELERSKKDTKLVDAKLEILDILMEGIE